MILHFKFLPDNTDPELAKLSALVPYIKKVAAEYEALCGDDLGSVFPYHVADSVTDPFEDRFTMFAAAGHISHIYLGTNVDKAICWVIPGLHEGNYYCVYTPESSSMEDNVSSVKFKLVDILADAQRHMVQAQVEDPKHNRPDPVFQMCYQISDVLASLSEEDKSKLNDQLDSDHTWGDTEVSAISKDQLLNAIHCAGIILALVDWVKYVPENTLFILGE